MRLPSGPILPALRSAGIATRVVLLSALLLVGAAGAAYAGAQAAKPGITLQISPTGQSVARGQSVSFAVSVTSTGGFAGTVALSAKGLPTGSSATFSPASVTLTGSGAAMSASSTVTVATASSTPVGSYTLTVTGASGKVSGSVTAGLTVNYPLSSSISMTATPSSVTLGAGSTAVYTVQLTRTNFPAPVSLALYGGLPAGATAAFTPSPTTGNSSTLQVATPATTVDGTYTLYMVGSGVDPSGRTQYAYASVQLVVSTSGSPFTISGDLSGALSPGVSVPLDLTVSNPNKKPLSVTNLTVTVSTGQPAAGYYLTRVSDTGTSAACGTSPVQPTIGNSCTDTGIPDGTYRYVVTAVYGSWTAASLPSGSVTVASDSIPPTVPAPLLAAAVVSGSDPVFVNHEVVTLTDAATDAGSGVDSVSYYYCVGATGACTSGNGTLIGSSTNPSNDFSVATDALLASPDSPYRIVAVATDNAGNTSGASAPTLVAVDTTPPTVSRPTVNGHSSRPCSELRLPTSPVDRTLRPRTAISDVYCPPRPPG